LIADLDTVMAVEHEVRARGSFLLIGLDGGLHIVPKRSRIPRELRLKVWRYRSDLLSLLRRLSN
jgi:hypothetical protein